ncbi:MAG: biotin--[acetyl-CoA-carboxylase] ligase [Alphaproteobacteria bacterium]|nr:biotin--[acetyl-CoA-carboxylase] ligase [Alphaproteobacteria bacterium]
MGGFYFYDILPSTMDEARRKVLEKIPEGSVIVAASQTEGRGRRGRIWESPLGNIYMTYITYFGSPLILSPQLSLVACVAVGESVRLALPPGNLLTYKWPNDLLLNKKKVGGLLLEAFFLPDREETAYLIGCGLNLKCKPQEARYPATSFQEEGIYIQYNEVLEGICFFLKKYIALWQKEGFLPIQTLWMDNSFNSGQKIIVDMQRQTYSGIFEGINDEGFLMLRTAQGLIKLAAGEIS